MTEESRKKINARQKVRMAIKKGILKRLPCIKCGNPKSEGHHVDYDKPLEVEWLCKKCHIAHHRVEAGLPPKGLIFCHKCGQELEEERKGKVSYCISCKKLDNWAYKVVRKHRENAGNR